MTVTYEGEFIDHHSPSSEVALVKADPIVVPAVSATAALEAWDAYQALKQRVAKPEDFQRIQGRDFPKKSLWRKMATFFNLSIEIVSEKEIKNEDGSIDFDVVYRAVAPNGRSMVGDGSCNSHEKKDRLGNPIANSRHNTRSTANTRAFNRAVSNLIGGGEVSAEEVEIESFKGETGAIAEEPPRSHITNVKSLVNENKAAPHYVIDLGTLKDGKPHWLNGKTMEQADQEVNKATHQSRLKDAFDYYKNSKFRNAQITAFLNACESFYAHHG